MCNKVGIFIRSLNKGGAENQSIELAKELCVRYDVKLIVLFKEGELINKANEELNKENVIFIEGSGYLSKAYFFYKFLRKERLNFLFCYLPSNNVIGIILGKLVGIKFIFGGLRGSKIKNNKLKMFFQKVLMNHFSTAIISNSYKAKETYSSFGIRSDKILVIHNGIEIKEPLIQREEKESVTILSVGRFVEEKDYETALFAINEIVKTNKNIKYTIVGYGEQESKIRGVIKELGICDYVEIIINPPDVNFYYKEADIYLMTSTNEGMPNTIMEAMSFSLPIVATDAGDTCYLVKDEVNGYICKKRDYIDVSNKAIELINSYPLRLEFGKRSLEIIKSEFSISKLRNNYELILDEYLK